MTDIQPTKYEADQEQILRWQEELAQRIAQTDALEHELWLNNNRIESLKNFLGDI